MNAKGSVQFGTLQAARLVEAFGTQTACPVEAFGTQEARPVEAFGTQKACLAARIDRSLALWFNLAVESLDVTRG